MSPVNAPKEATQGGRRNDKSGSASPEVIKVKVEPLESVADEERDWYWMGTLPSCPVQNVTAGGQCFPRFTGTPTFDVNGKPDRPLVLGAEMQLSERQVEHVKKGVANRILRKVGQGDKPRGMIINRDGPYRPERGDEPLGKYLFMARGRRQAELPEPMVD